MFNVTDFRLVVCSCIEKTMIFSKKKYEPVQDQCSQIVKDHCNDKFGNTEKNMPFNFQSV